jgi:hypothetical protein
MKHLLRGSVLSLIVTALIACGGGEQTPQNTGEPQSAAAPAAAPTADKAGQGMGGMQGMDNGMMAQMQRHMQTMTGASGDSLIKVLPEHRQMTANMLAQMNQQMRGMQGGPEWDEAVNAVRQDLTRMPEMSAEELQAYLPQHQEHVNRLMELHRSMMGNMKK